ncbi:hypothetical protein NGA_0692000, partial [Nannochloropsis gaditana CCMP526]
MPPSKDTRHGFFRVTVQRCSSVP